jgi:hypothetical protein
MENKSKVFDISFWIFLSVIYSACLLIYLVKNDIIFLLALIPLITVITQIIVAEKVRKQNNYFPKTLVGYFLLNFSFLLIFIISLVFLRENYLIIKLGTFSGMTLIGIYTSIKIIKQYKK